MSIGQKDLFKDYSDQSQRMLEYPSISSGDSLFLTTDLTNLSVS